MANDYHSENTVKLILFLEVFFSFLGERGKRRFSQWKEYCRIKSEKRNLKILEQGVVLVLWRLSAT